MSDVTPSEKRFAWLIGLFMIGMGVLQLWLTPPFFTKGVSAQARVVEVVYESSKSSDDYYPRYELVSRPDRATCEEFSGFYRWTAPDVGDTVAVVYEESTGELHCTRDSLLHRWGWPALCFGFGMAVLLNHRLVRH